MFSREAIAVQFPDSQKVPGFTGFLSCLPVLPLCIAVDVTGQAGAYIAPSPNPDKGPYAFGAYKYGASWPPEPKRWQIPGIAERTSEHELTVIIKAVAGSSMTLELHCNGEVFEELIDWTKYTAA